jgi:pyruvate dehydrogenase E1 component
VGDLIWAAADARARGFLLAATAGRTTLLGEGLQHQDGHSLVLASTVPPCQAYDPAFAYEMAEIVRHGLERMYGNAGKGNGTDDPDVFYYLTLYNENYHMPAKPEGCEDGIMRGLYRWSEAPDGPSKRATILFSGTAQGAAREAQRMLADEWDVGVELWSATSYKALREEALAAERWNRLHPEDQPRTPWVTEQLRAAEGPIVAVTDFMKVVPDQISRWVETPFLPLGTDGFGRSDTREALRAFFETDARHVVVAVLAQLCNAGDVKPETVAEAIRRYDIDPERADPRHT